MHEATATNQQSKQTEPRRPLHSSDWLADGRKETPMSNKQHKNKACHNCTWWTKEPNRHDIGNCRRMKSSGMVTVETSSSNRLITLHRFMCNLHESANDEGQRLAQQKGNNGE